MEDYLGQQPAHTEVVVKITPSLLSCGSYHLTALTWGLRQEHLQKNSETGEKSNKGWKLNSVVQLPHNESLKDSSSSTPKPLWVEGLHPQHPSWPPLRGRSHVTSEQTQELLPHSSFPIRDVFHSRAPKTTVMWCKGQSLVRRTWVQISGPVAYTLGLWANYCTALTLFLHPQNGDNNIYFQDCED